MVAVTWEFRLVRPGMPEVPIAGLDAATGRRLTVRLADSSSADFTINGRHPDAAAIEELTTDLVVSRGDAKLFRGRVGPSSDDVTDAQHAVSFSAWDYREVFNRRILLGGDTVNFSTVEQTQIAWTLLSTNQQRAGGDLGVTASSLVGSTGVNRSMFFDPGMKVAEQVDTIAQLDNGFEWEINPDLEFTPYWPLRGNQLSPFVADLGGSVVKVRRQVDPAQFANVLRLSGNGFGLFVDADIANSAAGRWETNVGNLDWSQVTIDARGPYQLAKLGLVPAYTVTLDPSHWSGPEALWVGDCPRLVVRSGRLDVDAQVLRVTEMTFSISDDGAESIEVALGWKPVSRDDRARSAFQRLDTLERR